MTSKYDPLKQHLIQVDRGRLQMSFADIEQIIGLPLPASARSFDAWWLDKFPNKHRAHAKAWLDAGRGVDCVDRIGEVVEFTSVRERKEPRLLDAVVFPTDKAELLECALRNDVPETIREAIGRLPDGTYYSRSDFVAAVESIASA
jgi:hypothetical protein